MRTAHFHDYSRAAFAMWLAIAAAGTTAAGWALLDLLPEDVSSLAAVAAALAMVVAAAWFPVEIPRSKYSIGASDAFIFTTLALLGPAAAVLAAGMEGLVGAWRSTRRVSSRISTPAAAMAAMAVGGEAFEWTWMKLVSLHWDAGVAKLAALTLTALVPFVLSSLSLTSTVTLKRGQWPALGPWFGSSAWIAAIYLAAASLAGMVQLGTVGRGPAPALIAGVATLTIVILLRLSIRRSESERQVQDERIRIAEHDAASSQKRFASAFTSAAIGMAIVDSGGNVVRANEALCSLLQRAEAEICGSAFSALLHPEDLHLLQHADDDRARTAETGAPAIEMRCATSSGDERWIALHSSRFDDPEQQLHGLIYQLRDITAHRAAQQRLQHIAYHDSLTHLPNRAAFYQRVSEAMADAEGDPGAGFAVVFLDLDRFKVVNDSLGHLAGNELLREVARRLLQSLRPNDLVARLGGDEFALLFLDADKQACIDRTQGMLATLSAPCVVKGHELVPAASAGLTFSDLGQRTVDEMLRDADLAMYEAKSTGASGVAVFDRTMHSRIADKLALETDLRHAVGSNGLSLVFQPVFELDSQKLMGFEALARWNHPTRGPLRPDMFVALAEETGHIGALTTWVLDTAISRLAAWRKAMPGMEDVRVQVNASGWDLGQSTFVERVVDCLARYSVPARLLTLEITESVLMHHIEAARQTLTALRAEGVKVAIDDFGTGYSSLAYLSRLPIDSIKIDKSFVWAMETTAHDMEIVKAVTHLGHAMGKKIVAEGIETPRQRALLQELGVDEGQGFLLGRPMEPEQATSLMKVGFALVAET